MRQEETNLNIKQMLKHRFKFAEEDVSWNHADGTMVLRWYSDKFGERGDEYWFIMELGQRTGLVKKGIAFCWLNWNLGGSNHFVHIPCISKIQSVEGLLAMMYGLGYPKIEVRDDKDVEERYLKNKDVFEIYESPELLTGEKK